MKEYTVKVDEDGNKSWYLSDQLHREDGPAIEKAGGSKIWFLNGQRHREDGPAVEWADGSKFWFLNGQLHREDGPAIERAGGTKGWYLNGYFLTEEEHKQRTTEKKCEHIKREWVGLTDEEIDYVEDNVDPVLYRHFAKAIEAKLKEKNT
jgi:hypothetical protein